MLATRVGRRGQIVLPKEVRTKIKVAEGDQIAFVIDGEQVVIKPITHTLLELRGRVKVSKVSMICPPRHLTAAISTISATNGYLPDVSVSNPM